jgi:hypothetical protein
MEMGVQHFEGCHPEDERSADTPDGHVPQDTEQCWHCGTSTDQGCYCLECAQQSHYIPAGAVYHCKRCGRWWAYMTGINVTTITFPWNL